jgi:hypothetical protein
VAEESNLDRERRDLLGVDVEAIQVPLADPFHATSVAMNSAASAAMVLVAIGPPPFG